MELTNSQLTIAALVHDIGKLYQRAKMPLGEFADAKGVYLPFQKKGNYYSHEHALYTAKWMKDFITNDERFIQVSALHHRHDINEADIVHWVELIKRADRLASGLDRNEYPDDYEGKAKNYKQTRLHSLYNRLHGRKTEHEGIYELIQTGPNDCFPVNYTQKQNQDSEAEYKKLVEQLEKQMRFLPNETLDETFVHRLLNIFEATLTTIPAATNAYPDHSLFDHSKVVAAIAGCLYSAHAETKPFLLVEGDLSGIQKFIFEVTEGEQTRKHVAKSLRGRSTFMTLLTDFIAAYLVSEVGVMATNILYSSGGTFQIILPNTQAAKLKLEQAQAKVTASLYEQFNTRLGIVFGAVELTDVQLQQKYGKSLQQVKDQIVEKKDQRFKQLMMENDATFFVKAIPHADETLCELCAVQRTCHTRCQMCELLVQLGELITTGINYTIEFDFSLKNQVKKSVFAIEIPQIGIITLHNEVETTTEYALVINQAKQGLKVKTIGNALPTSNGETLSFEAVAATAKGGNRLGVLKMDVDNLGFTFALGFTQEQQSISRITTMSRQFEWFFTSYINVICENVSEELDYDENIFYITYAGGDDLLVVGPWNAMLYLAQAIQREFSDFTYNHPQLTLSAGLAIMKPKQPIRIAAKEANAALTAAKLAPNKNAISVLDAVFPWSAQYEWSFEQLLEDFEYFSEQVEQKTVSNTLFYNLAMISTQTSGTTFSATDYGLVPNIAYAMKRNLDVRSEVYQELKQRLLIADHTNQLPYIQYPFKLVILSQRS